MKLARLLPLVALVACSSSEASQAPASIPAGESDGSTLDASVDDGGSAYDKALAAAVWTKLEGAPSAPAGAKLDDAYFVTPKLGFAVHGVESSIYRTKDGGDTWAKVFTNKGTFFRSILFVDEKTGFAGNLGAGLSSAITDETVLYRTTDGGDTWAPITEIGGDAPKGICNLTAVDDKHLIAVGRANGPAHMITSSDGGKSWTAKDLTDQMSMLIDARFTSPTEGIIVGMSATSPSSCAVMRTTDGGKTFATVFASTQASSLCWKVSFPSPSVGYVSVQGYGRSFAKTTDGGKTWVELPLPSESGAEDAFPALAIGFVTDDIGWVSSSDPAQPNYRTLDGGKTWTKDKTLDGPVNRFRFVDAKTAYAVGASVWKLGLEAKAP